jgi:fructose 1,6-bisphosphatase
VSTEKAIQDIYDKLHLLGNIQQLIVQHIVEQNPEFMGTYVAGTLSIDKVRKSFSDYVLQDDDVPDDIKLFMMEMNEYVNEMEEE